MQVVSRFAPSPTGRLHLGHAYSALLAYDSRLAAACRALGVEEHLTVGDVEQRARERRRVEVALLRRGLDIWG